MWIISLQRIDKDSLLEAQFPELSGYDTSPHCVWALAHEDGELFAGICAELTTDGTFKYRHQFTKPGFVDMGDQLEEALDFWTTPALSATLGKEKPIMPYPETWRNSGVGDNSKLFGPMNSIVGFWPYPETTFDNWASIEQAYRAVACTYQADMQIVFGPDQIVLPDDRPVISIQEPLEGTRSQDYSDFEYPLEAVYVVGNSAYRHLSEHMDTAACLHIPTPGGYDHPLYGSQALAIVMQERFNQQGITLAEG
jgi:hypothetical protein